jgi:hypothetical protein
MFHGVISGMIDILVFFSYSCRVGACDKDVETCMLYCLCIDAVSLQRARDLAKEMCKVSIRSEIRNWVL